MASVTFQPSGLSITAEAGETIATAAERQGIQLRVSCANGVCQICKGERLTGTVHCRNSLAQTILEQHNQVLCCACEPINHIELYMTDVHTRDHKPEVTLACQVPVVELLADNIYRVELLAPAGTQFDFWPGQYVLLHVVDEQGQPQQFPYSIASIPSALSGQGDGRRLELHIAANSDTANAVIQQLKTAVVVKATLPGGDCILTPEFIQQHRQQPLIMVAAGSGFSQIKALTEAALALNPEQEIHIYWSNRARIGFYLSELPRQWAHEFANVHYHPVIEQHADDWQGRAGWLYQVIHEDFDDLSQVQLFACGSPNMVYGTLDQLAPLGLTQANMHSDVFAYAPRD